jgi:hypothetical protein
MNLQDLIHIRHIDANAPAFVLDFPISDRRIKSVRETLTPMKWPSKLVPPAYGTTGMRYLLAIFTTFTTSAVEFGYTTTLCATPKSVHASSQHQGRE